MKDRKQKSGLKLFAEAVGNLYRGVVFSQISE
jgi:hypothetical protein